MICLGILVMWCQMQQAPPTADTFCRNYKPVYWSPKDTRESKEANDTNNRKWKRLCRSAN